MRSASYGKRSARNGSPEQDAIAALLDERAGLRYGLSLDHARDIIWIYNDPALHYALVHARGWDQDHYLDWLTDNLHHHLLG